MALSIGELFATVSVDPEPAARGIGRVEANMRGLTASAALTAATVRGSLTAALAELPEVELTADATPAEREVAELRERIRLLHDVRIGVDIPVDEAEREVAEIRAALTALGESAAEPEVRVQAANALPALTLVGSRLAELDNVTATPEVRADTAQADRALAEVAGEAEAVDHMSPRVDVRVDDHGSAGAVGGRLGALASAAWGAVSAVAGFLRVPGMVGAGIPVVAALVGTLANVAPAAMVGVAAVFALVGAVAAIKIGTGGIGSALKAAFAPAVSGGGAAAGAALKAADAQRNLQRATENAAYGNEQAVKQTARAERDLADAQRAALAAQKAINAARKAATRDLEDQNNDLIDAQNGAADAQNALEDAQAQLAADQAQGAGSEQIERDQLAIREATQALAEQQLQVDRLRDDTTAAAAAGVDGSQQVTDAQAAAAAAARDVSDREQALADAREQQARTAQQGLDAIRQAQEALTQSTGGGAGAVNALDAAMAKLAPSARAFVREVMALRPAWRALQLDVQQRLFAGFAAGLASTAAVVLPVLRRSLDDTAGSLNLMGLGVLGAARTLATSGVLGQALGGAAAGLRSLVRIPGQVVTALGQVGAAGAPMFQRLTAAAGKAADGISSKLSAAFASGGMARAIDQAVSVLGQLGTIAGNVFSVIGSVVDAANASGGSWLGVLEQITGAMAAAFASPGVQAALGSLFSVMRVLGETLGPLVAQALGAIAPVLVALGPPVQSLVTALGAALRPVIAALGPVLVAAAVTVGQLADALDPVLVVVGQMVASLGPVLTPILRLVGKLFVALAAPLALLAKSLLPPLAKVTGTLVTAFARLSPVLDVAMQQLGAGLAPVVAGLATVVGDLVDAYADQFMRMFTQLLPVIPMLIPMFLQFARSSGEMLTAIAPLIPQLMLLTAQFITQLLPAIIPLIPPLAKLTMGLTILATGAIVHVVIPALKLLIGFLSGLRAAMQPGIDAVKWFTTTVARAFEWLSDHLVGHSVIPDMVRAIVGWLGRLPGMAASALASFPSRVGGIADGAARWMITAVRQGLDGAVGWLGGLPDRARRALGDLSGVLWNSGQALLRGFIGGIKSMGGLVDNAVSSVLQGAKDFFPNSPAKRGPFSGQGWSWHSGRATARDWAAGALAEGDAVAAAAASLMGGADGQLSTPQALGSVAAGGGAVADGTAGAGGTQAVTLRIVMDGPEAVRRLVRTIVSDGGGNVQTVLGR